MFEFTRTETVGADGMIHLALPNIEPGKRVEIVVREEQRKVYRTAGGLEGKIKIAPDFDDPISEMEPYS